MAPAASTAFVTSPPPSGSGIPRFCHFRPFRETANSPGTCHDTNRTPALFRAMDGSLPKSDRGRNRRSTWNPSGDVLTAASDGRCAGGAPEADTLATRTSATNGTRTTIFRGMRAPPKRGRGGAAHRVLPATQAGSGVGTPAAQAQDTVRRARGSSATDHAGNEHTVPAEEASPSAVSDND